MLSDTDAACGVIILALYLIKGKKSQLDQTVVQTKAIIHKRKSHDRLNLEWAKRLSLFVLFQRSSSDGLLKTVTHHCRWRITNMKQSIKVFIHHATLFGHWK